MSRYEYFFNNWVIMVAKIGIIANCIMMFTLSMLLGYGIGIASFVFGIAVIAAMAFSPAIYIGYADQIS